MAFLVKVKFIMVKLSLDGLTPNLEKSYVPSAPIMVDILTDSKFHASITLFVLNITKYMEFITKICREWAISRAIALKNFEILWLISSMKIEIGTRYLIQGVAS